MKNGNRKKKKGKRKDGYLYFKSMAFKVFYLLGLTLVRSKRRKKEWKTRQKTWKK